MCQKRFFRCLSHPLFRDANPRGCTPLFNRAGSRSTHATGRPWCMEHDTSMVRRYRDSIVHRHLLRSTLLQRHHYLVLLLSFQFTGGEFPSGPSLTTTDRFDRYDNERVDREIHVVVPTSIENEVDWSAEYERQLVYVSGGNGSSFIDRSTNECDLCFTPLSKTLGRHD